jgi:hypothetical protein
MKTPIFLFGLGVIVLITLSAAGLTQTFQVVNAFCIFNCAAEDLKNRLQANADCIKTQIEVGIPGRTTYGTEDLSTDGKEVRGNCVINDTNILR